MPFVDATCAGRYAINLFAALSNSRCRGAAADMRPVILGFGQKGNNAVRACVDRALPLKWPGAAFASRKMQHSVKTQSTSSSTEAQREAATSQLSHRKIEALSGATDRRAHSCGRMSASLITFDHLAISDLMVASSASGVEPSLVIPRSA